MKRIKQFLVMVLLALLVAATVMPVAAGTTGLPSRCGSSCASAAGQP